MGKFYFTIFIVSFNIVKVLRYHIHRLVWLKLLLKFCCEQFFSTWVIQILHEQFYFCLWTLKHFNLVQVWVTYDHFLVIILVNEVSNPEGKKKTCRNYERFGTKFFLLDNLCYFHCQVTSSHLPFFFFKVHKLLPLTNTLIRTKNVNVKDLTQC